MSIFATMMPQSVDTKELLRTWLFHITSSYSKEEKVLSQEIYYFSSNETQSLIFFLPFFFITFFFLFKLFTIKKPTF